MTKFYVYVRATTCYSVPVDCDDRSDAEKLALLAFRDSTDPDRDFTPAWLDVDVEIVSEVSA